MSTTLPPAPSDKALSAALDGFAAALGPPKVLTSEAELAEFRDPFAYATWDDYTASAVVMPTSVEEVQEVAAARQRAQGAAVDARPGPQQRLRRPGTARARLGDRQPAQHEPRARDQRGAPPTRWSSRACAGSTSTTRSGRAATSCGSRSPTSAGAASSATRSTTASATCPYGQDMARPVRHGGRARQRRGAAHGHGRDAGQQVVARLQARPRPVARPAVHAVQLRDRHEDGRLADAAARDATAVLGAGVGGGRPRADGRHAAHAAARSHDRRRAVALQHALPRLGALEPRRSGTTARARSRTT